MKLPALVSLAVSFATVMALPGPDPLSAAICKTTHRQDCYRKQCSIAACCGLEAGANLRAYVFPR
ncbi:hypothetical protein PGT21_001784 [Puccinia graminis f. sp. tritici]|uniref:Uncharacterized protein n=1 Tax=Puccinia graminis f. sp. tritici TaxID=56615 RepID=A0A5B0MKG5_PUCGR|nr:hypothetical protein PGT21_001784 [Puccinia graminis f. sp. tritici]KAA1135651.1 hypothetical protein PGTUg99_028685 [Puccinia graminis f. sp. tritici]